MYMTCLAGSPWAKMVSFLANLPTLLPRPVESRKRFTSKTRLFDFARGGARRGLGGTTGAGPGFANLFKIAQFGGGARPLVSMNRCAKFRGIHCGRRLELRRCRISTRFATSCAATRGQDRKLHRSGRRDA